MTRDSDGADWSDPTASPSTSQDRGERDFAPQSSSSQPMALGARAPRVSIGGDTRAAMARIDALALDDETFAARMRGEVSVRCVRARAQGEDEDEDGARTRRCTASLGGRSTADGEHALGFKGKNVVWTVGGGVRARFTCQDDVKDVCWCRFQGEEPTSRPTDEDEDEDKSGAGWFLCVLHRDSWTLYGLSGEFHTIPLGFDAVSFAATKMGLLFTAKDGSTSLAAHTLDAPTAIDGFVHADYMSACVVWSDAMRDDVLVYVPARGVYELWMLSREPAARDTEFSDAVPEFKTCARLCWSERAPTFAIDSPTEAMRYSLVHDEAGREMILMSNDVHEYGRVLGFYVSESPNGERCTAEIIGHSALGVSATRSSDGLLDTIYIDHQGFIVLCVGLSVICKIGLENVSGRRSLGALRLSQCVNSDVTVRTRENEVLRVRMPGALASPVARALLRVLQDACSPEDYYEVKRRLYMDERVGAAAPEDEWSHFVRVLKYWCGFSTTTIDSGEMSDWEYAQRVLSDDSACIRARVAHENESNRVATRVNVDVLRSQTILVAVHALYEACKMDVLHRTMLKQLRDLALSLAHAIGDAGYIDFYSRDSGVSISPLTSSHYTTNIPDIMRACEGLFAGRSDFDSLVPPLILAGLEANSSIDASTFGGSILVHARRVVRMCHICSLSNATLAQSGGMLAVCMGEMGFKVEDLERLPLGLAIPFHGTLQYNRHTPANGLPAEAYELIGRRDLALIHSERGLSVLRRSEENEAQATTNLLDDAEQTCDGLEHLEGFVGPLRFPRDYRIRELRELLATASPVPISLEDTDGDAGDSEQGSQQQSKLWLMAARTSAMPVGRGAATLSTLLVKPTEVLGVPELCLAGCLPTQQFAVVNLDLTATNAPAGFVNWPDFHNGAAAGLALRSDAKSGKLTRAWIVFNRPKVPTFSHAGVLMALGLNGHLSSLTATDLYRYLSQEHEATTVGTLLGVAASKLGTADPATSRMCFLHLPTRHPLSFPEIELPPLVQSAALLAVGLLYQGTAQRLIVETLLSELGKSPEGDVVSGRECYALSAGIALGLVTLGRGHNSMGLSDLHVAERLRHFIAGGIARKIPPPGGVPPSYRKSTSGAAEWHDGVEDMTESSIASVDGYILEGSMVNVDLSAPGAMMALAMMYMKSNDETVAAYLDIPSTHYALDNARPDYVLLRVVTRSMIMWDSIESDTQWIEGLLPPLLRGAMDAKTPEEREAQDDASWLGEADVEAIAQTYVNVIAGGCMSMGLRYAGSGNVDAAKTLRHYAFKFLDWKKTAGQGDQILVSKAALEICIGVIAMSLACVMAGTGDLPTLRLLRHLRSRLDTSSSANSTGLTYGAHMAVGLANGFLFLGGGSQTFSTDNASIAALMIAMFPRFPSTTSDNRWHCQAYRHLYVLAARPRLLQTVDATTLDAVSTPLEMTCTVKGKEITTQLITPCLLPDPSSLVRIRLISPRYWPLTLDFSDGRDDAKKKLYALRRVPIQRHTGALSYEVDRTGAKAQLATALHAAGAKAALKPSTSAFFEQNTAPVANATAAQAGKDAVDVFTSDVTLLAFSHAMCDGSSDRAGFTAAALRECMEREVPEALRAYVDLYASCESLTHASSTSHEEFATQASLAVSDLRLLDAFNAFITRKSAITKEQSTNVSPVPELLSASFRRSVLLSLEGAYGDSALARYLRGQGYDASADARGAFGCYLRLLDMPNPKVLRHAMESGGAGATTSASAVRARLPHLAPSAVLRIIEACLEVVEEEYA